MSAIEPLYGLMHIPIDQLPKKYLYLIEAELFLCIYNELKEIFRNEHKMYFRVMKYTTEMENSMLENNFTHLMLQDILLSEEYTLEGIARYMNVHEDIVQEVYFRRNTNPSAIFLRKIIELHRFVRHDLYNEIMKKIIAPYISSVSA